MFCLLFDSASYLLFDSASYQHCPCPGCTWKGCNLPCSSDSIQSPVTVFLSQSPLQGYLRWLCRAEFIHFALPPVSQKQRSHVGITSAEHTPVCQFCLEPGTSPIFRGPESTMSLPFMCTHSSEVLSLVLHSFLLWLNYLRSSNRSGKEQALNQNFLNIQYALGQHVKVLYLMKSMNLDLKIILSKDTNFLGCLWEKLKTLLVLHSPFVLAASYHSKDVIFHCRKR